MQKGATRIISGRPAKQAERRIYEKEIQKELTAEQLAALPDDAIDTSDIPELGQAFWDNARVVMPEERLRTQITAKFDTDMVDWFKKQGRGYQNRMNAVLRSFYKAHDRE